MEIHLISVGVVIVIVESIYDSNKEVSKTKGLFVCTVVVVVPDFVDVPVMEPPSLVDLNKIVVVLKRIKIVQIEKESEKVTAPVTKGEQDIEIDDVGEVVKEDNWVPKVKEIGKIDEEFNSFRSNNMVWMNLLRIRPFYCKSLKKA